MTNNPTLVQPGDRQYFLDWVRVLAFALLIFYHTGMMFVGWEYHIESGYDSEFLRTIMSLTSSWRLDLLFVVSGVAISFMIAKMPIDVFTRQRHIKLSIPLLFAIAVVVAPQSYFEAVQKGVFEGNYWQFLTSLYFTFSWDERMFSPFPTPNHMWYVAYLAAYTFALIPLYSYINGERGKARLLRIENWLNQGARIIWVPLCLYASFLGIWRTDVITHAFYNDWYGHSIYLLALLMGLLFVRMPSVWDSLERNRGTSFFLALSGYVLLLALYKAQETVQGYYLAELDSFAGIFVKWTWMATILGHAKRYLNFTNPVLAYCNNIVYPFFILHQTVIIVLGFYAIDWGMTGTLEFLVIALGTFVICGALTEFVIKKVNILRLVFGMKWQRRDQASENTATTT